MRMQVILDSSFARPGSAPIWGGKKGEFRDWTKYCIAHPYYARFSRHYMRANERVHVENVRDFSQAKFESEINVFFS